jgi:hypothetical protein
LLCVLREEDLRRLPAMPNTLQETWTGHRVKFLIRDVHLPEPAVVVQELLRSGATLRGKVIDVSDSGTEGGGFLVVRCGRLRQPCVLPVERVERID